MNENMDTMETRTESPTGGTTGAGQVFSVFRQDKMALTALICLSVMMEIVILFIFIINEWQVFPPPPIVLLILLALTFVPGCIVRRIFKNDVIPACRGVCSDKEIVSDAWKSLLFMWEVCFLCMLPVVVIMLKSIFFHDPWTGHPYDDFGDSIILSCVAALLGYCPMAIFPVARLFSRRVGMIVTFILIILGQIILLLHALLLEVGFPYFTDGDVKVKENISFTGFLSVICITLFFCAFGYFLYVAYKDTEKKGLLY